MKQIKTQSHEKFDMYLKIEFSIFTNFALLHWSKGMILRHNVITTVQIPGKQKACYMYRMSSLHWGKQKCNQKVCQAFLHTHF